MTKESKDLALIHAHVESADGLHAIGERLRQIVDLEELLLLLEVDLVVAWCFKVFLLYELRLKLIVNLVLFFISEDKLLSLIHI